MQTHITRQADFYLDSDGDRLPFEALLIAMQSIACDTVITANRPGPWPRHERYSDKQVTPKARHNSHDEVPYEKNKGSSKLPRQLHDYILDCVGCTTSLASCSESFLSLTRQNQIGRQKTKL